MDIVKLDATDSTSSYLKGLMLSKTVSDYTVVVTDNQLNGRGQMGSLWCSEVNKNLTFSVLKYFDALPISDSFLITIAISKAVHSFLSTFNVPKLSIKWPNDIMSVRSKLCGILIENTLAGDKIKSSVIGIGLNINQIDFGNMQNATSLKLITGRDFDLKELLPVLLKEIKKELDGLARANRRNAILAYESLLFRKDIPSTFKSDDGGLFMGIVRGVAPQGRLRLALEDGTEKEYGLKELKLLF